MVKMPVFKAMYEDKENNPENRKDFERLFIQSILTELKYNKLINSEELSEAVNILYLMKE